MDTGNKVLMFISSVALLATVIYLLIQLANFMGGLQLGEPGEAELERIAERIQPIGRVAYGPVDVEEEAADLSPGDIYSNVCAACHDTGASDAPLKDDSDAWAARLDERSLDEVFDNAIGGMGAMPPRGGDASLSDEDVKLVSPTCWMKRALIMAGRRKTPMARKTATTKSRLRMTMTCWRLSRLTTAM